MPSSPTHSPPHCRRLALFLLQPDTAAATAFARAYPHHKAITSPVSSDGLLPIHYASLLGDATLLCALLNGGASVDSVSLKFAASRAHLDALHELLRHASTEVIQNSGEVLFEAAYRGSIECVSALVKAGAPTGFRGPDGSLPLHLAALSGSVAMVDCLLQSGANPSAVDGQGATPSICAKRVGHRAVVGRLRAATTEMEEQRSLGTSATAAEIRARSLALVTSFNKERLNRSREEDGCISSGDRTAGISPTLSDDSMEVEEDFPDSWEEHVGQKATQSSSMNALKALSNEARFTK